MKQPMELDHYEVLELSRDAAEEELERAYRLMKETYAEGSLATYSIFDESETAAMLERVEIAYSVLSDPESRNDYDRSLAAGSGEIEVHIDEDLDAVDIALDLEPDSVRAEAFPVVEEFAEAIDEDEAPWGGARLRRNRLQRGIELDEIARITKVNPTYLRFIEEEQFDGLPAPVYVRGFVTAYAHCIGLDAAHVVPGFLERFEASRGPSPAGRFGAARRR